MQELYNIGISDITVKSMLELNPNLVGIKESEIIKKEDFLKKNNCSTNQIISIMGTNSIFLTRSDKDLYSLVEFLSNIGFTNLNVLFDSNPFILNLEQFEIKKYIDSQITNNKKIDDIIDELESNPYLFNDM